jgi:hypothetical protein
MEARAQFMAELAPTAFELYYWFIFLNGKNALHKSMGRFLYL